MEIPADFTIYETSSVARQGAGLNKLTSLPNADRPLLSERIPSKETTSLGGPQDDSMVIHGGSGVGCKSADHKLDCNLVNAELQLVEGNPSVTVATGNGRFSQVHRLASS